MLVSGGGTIDGQGKIWWQNSCKINKSQVRSPLNNFAATQFPETTSNFRLFLSIFPIHLPKY